MRGRGCALLFVPSLIVTVAACAGDGSAGPTQSTGTAGTADDTLPPASSSAPESSVADAVALPLRFGSVTERSVDGGADGRNTTAAVAGMNEFAVDVYRAVVAEQGGNTIVGPYSATFALSMIYAGARGQTATEMAQVLHADGLDPADWHEGINAYDLTLDARTTGSPTEWNAANKVWTRPGLALRGEYLDVLTGAYGSPLAEVDFGADSEKARRLINDWIADETTELIPELFPTGSFDTTTRMVLVNAVAMDAPWEFPFDPAATVPAPFTLADGTAVEVPMMHYGEYLPSLWTEDLQAVELPYGGGTLSMVVIAPTDLAAFEAELTTESLAAVIDQIQEGGIHLSLPKWTARTHVQMNDSLAALGMPTAFSAAADFSGMVDGGGLFLAQVEHEAMIVVDEQGTRAAAATGGEMAASHGPMIEINRPYLYLIRDRGSGTIMFIGRVTDPTLEP
jgi:serpin B